MRYDGSKAPPPRNPKFLNPSFSNLRFWGKLLALQAPDFFFLASQGGIFF